MSYSKIKLYLTGLLMGIADLIPGISGSTVAHMCGIYPAFLENIKTLQFRSFKKINWPFLLPLFCGIATSLILFSRIVYFLLVHYRPHLFAFFFGLIAASTVISVRVAKIKHIPHVLALLMAALCSYSVSSMTSSYLLGNGFFYIVCAGVAGSAAMLLPGISGSFVLQVLGVYPFLISALSTPTQGASLKFLINIGIGIAFGFIIFSRAFSWTLRMFPITALSILIGFMAGGLRALWPFYEGGSTSLLVILLLLGFLTMTSLEMLKLRIRTYN